MTDTQNNNDGSASQNRVKYKTPKSSIYSTLGSITSTQESIHRKVKLGMFAEALQAKDDLELLISTLGDQLETHVE